MPGDVRGVLLSVSLILFCWAVAMIIKRTQPFGEFSSEFARKVVHIGVSNFAFIYLYIFDNDIWPIIGLVSFALINLYIETHTGKRRSWGTVEFPLSIALLIVIRSLTGGFHAHVAVATLGMGYGDGLAALVGKKFGKIKLSKNSNKTLAGFITVFAVVTLIAALLSGVSIGLCFIIGLVTALVEFYTPFGLDNVTVPLIIYFLEVLFC